MPNNNQPLTFNQYLGAGKYNCAFLDSTKKWVLKVAYHGEKPITPGNLLIRPSIQVLSTLSLDTPERSVRVWNEINPGMPAKLWENPCTKGTHWICPYISGRKSTSDEIIDKLIEIYTRTGRIVVDGLVPGNFKTTNDGEVICVDIGAALKLDCKTTDRTSEASLNFWSHMKDTYTDFFNKYENDPRYQKTLITIKALLMFQYFNNPIEYDIKDPNVRCTLASYYNKTTEPELPMILSVINKQFIKLQKHKSSPPRNWLSLGCLSQVAKTPFNSPATATSHQNTKKSETSPTTATPKQDTNTPCNTPNRIRVNKKPFNGKTPFNSPTHQNSQTPFNSPNRIRVKTELFASRKDTTSYTRSARHSRLYNGR